MNSNCEELDKASLGILPNPLKLLRALMRPNQPFVMINMLSYKQQATGDYSHLAGVEAYEVYAKSVEKVQGPLGSRLLWSGQIRHDMGENKFPFFDAIGLLEYASPKAFLQANFKGKTNTKARSAGLKGQWLIASRTLADGETPDLDEEHVVMIELSGEMNQNPKTVKRWFDVRQSIYKEVGAKTIWHGQCDQHILGIAKPQIEDVLVTWFPNPTALEEAVHGLQRKKHRQSIRPYLTCTASSIDFLHELR
ncbi:MAG: hypothetical protein GWO08_09660 [Gammaproteobacteria bacterium]|nr:hypothetical protein [Gammaproteobacteria bacterium]